MNSKESTKELQSTIFVTLFVLAIVVSSVFLTLEEAPRVYKELHRIVIGTDFEFRYVLISRIVPYVTMLGCMVEKSRRFFLDDDASLLHILFDFLKLIVVVWMTIFIRHLVVRFVMATSPWFAFERTIGCIPWLFILKDLAFFVLLALSVSLCDRAFKLCSWLWVRLQRLECK